MLYKLATFQTLSSSAYIITSTNPQIKAAIVATTIPTNLNATCIEQGLSEGATTKSYII